MANLFVLNPTTQDHGFNWREAESPRVFSKVIPAGHQVQILNGVPDSVYHSVVDQHKRYGMLTVSEAKKARKDGLIKVSLVYSDQPMPADIYELVDEINEDIASRQIQLEKERTAVASIKAIQENPELNQGVEAVELEIIEQTPKEQERKSKTLVKQKFSSNAE